MAMGKPVVGTRVGGIPEEVLDGETGRLCEPDDPAAMADAMLGLIDSPELLRSMGRKARQRAERHFSSERMAEEVEQVYRQLVHC